ncbi:phospholipase-like protein [Artemisia annua]|uniref:Phospholipase-like protein n=1 Tax=Artemisia annua TaxID=35608 RepID=A0A2U1LAM1_ARTAN|nr:phospholipase-like protein [Artemisia annua]
MESRLSSSSVSLEIELTKVGEELLRRPYSTKEIIKSLVETENILSRLPQSASISMIKPLHLIIKALFAEDLVRHSNMVVKIKISVTCCICEIMRIMEPDTPFNDNQMKVFFELVVTAFEKVSSSSGECHTKMIKIASPVRTQLAKKVLKNYADQLNPDIPDMVWDSS